MWFLLRDIDKIGRFDIEQMKRALGLIILKNRDLNEKDREKGRAGMGYTNSVDYSNNYSCIDIRIWIFA